MNKTITALILYILASQFLIAQKDVFKLTGNITDSNSNLPLEFVSIAILSRDSVYIGGTISDSIGKFYLESIPKSGELIRLSLMGYKTSFHMINYDKTNYQFTMLQDDRILNEITIKGSIPEYRLKNGNLVINVAGTLLSSIGNTFDVIEQIPGVLVEDKSVVVFGKGTPTIYINNRRIYDNNELLKIQSSDILSIELLKNPGSKYDAKVQSVILIKTKNNESGFSGNILAQIKESKKLGTYDMLRLTYSNNKMNFYSGYNYEYEPTPITEKVHFTIYGDTLWNQILHRENLYKTKTHNFDIGTDYKIIDDQSIGIQYQGTLSTEDHNTLGNEYFSMNNILKEELFAEASKRQKEKSHNLNFFYDATFYEIFNVRIDMDYLNKKSPSTQSTYEESNILSNSRRIRIDSNADFDLWANKVVGNYKFSNSNKLEIGSEYSKIEGNGFYFNDQEVNNNNIYSNKEDKVAIFSDYLISFRGWDTSLGLRYERLHEKIIEGTNSIIKMNKVYHNIYPNFMISKTFSDISLGLNGNIRTERPSFSMLNSNDLYINPLLTQKGNPYLIQQDIYSLGLNTNYKHIFFELGYSYTKNPISFNMHQQGGSKANSVITLINFDHYQAISTMISIKKKINFWNPSTTIGITKPFFKAVYQEKERNYNNVNLNVKFNNDFILPYKFILSLYFTYQNNYQTLVSEWKGYTLLNARIRKSMLDDRLKINIYANDIFNSQKGRDIIRINNYDFIVNKTMDTQYIRFTIQYLFKSNQKNYKGRNASEDIYRL